MAGVGPDDIDLMICGYSSPDIDWPGNVSLLQDRLGIPPVTGFDVRNQCSAFVLGTAVADQYIRSGGARHVLLVGVRFTRPGSISLGA